jgi:hypothetical protein
MLQNRQVLDRYDDATIHDIYESIIARSSVKGGCIISPVKIIALPRIDGKRTSTTARRLVYYVNRFRECERNILMKCDNENCINLNHMVVVDE